MSSLRGLFDPWAMKTAWRDLRRHRGRFFLLAVTLSLGLAAATAISALGWNLQSALDDEARSLLGADLRIESRRRLDDDGRAAVQRMIDASGAEHASRLTFSSMLRATSSGEVRLVRVRAVEGPYPFFGALEAEPPEAATSWRQGRRALVDDGVLHQLDVRVGEFVELGSRRYEVVGRLVDVPGESASQSLVGPRIFVPRSEVDPALLEKGSRLREDVFLRLPDGSDAQEFVKTWEETAFDHDLDLDTVKTVREGWGRAAEDLEGYLGLVALSSLVLGAAAIASALGVHLETKRASLAVLRCLGATRAQAFAVFLWQVMGLAVVAIALGLGGATAVLYALPGLVETWLPVPLERSMPIGALVEGTLLGLATTGLSAAIPLWPLRSVSPSDALRARTQPATRGSWWLRGIALVCAVAAALRHAPQWTTGLWFAGGLLAAAGLLLATAHGLRVVLRRAVPRAWPWAWRQGLANVARPGHQARLTTLCLGLGVFSVTTLGLSRESLVRELRGSVGEERANLVLFDVQPDQVEPVDALLRAGGHSVLQNVPIVTLRLTHVAGTSVADLRADDDADIPEWTLVREYRCTYRDALEPSERLVKGRWFDGPAPTDGPTPISLEERIAERLGVGVGDSLRFTLQGVGLETVITSLREVEWRSARPNFFVVFPPGVLDEAPRFHVMLTHAETPEVSAAIQRDVVDAHPNVSALDVTKILDVIDDILARITSVVGFMASFGVVTGLIVLVGTLWGLRAARADEAVLLRTLGASQRQVRGIWNAEFLTLGGVAAGAGVALAVLASALIAHYVFRGRFVFAPTVAFASIGVTAFATWIVGTLTSRDLARRPPLDILRER